MKESKTPRVDSRVWGSGNECPDYTNGWNQERTRKVISVCGMLCRWHLGDI